MCSKILAKSSPLSGDDESNDAVERVHVHQRRGSLGIDKELILQLWRVVEDAVVVAGDAAAVVVAIADNRAQSQREAQDRGLNAFDVPQWWHRQQRREVVEQRVH